ncbi:MAG: hypothetical protein ABSF37_04325 [Sedimentisphaerales bacterium]|jgi:hypothetical protein
MKIKSLLFAAVAIAFVAAASYHIGGSMQGRNPNLKSTHIVAEPNHSPHSQRNTVDLSNKERGSINTPLAVNVPIKPEAARSQRTVRQYTPTITPDSIIDERLLYERNVFLSQWDQIKNSNGIPQQNRVDMLLQLQQEYNDKKTKLLTAKQQLAAIRQFKEQGSIDEEGAMRAAWYIAGLPRDTVENISLPKPTLVPVPPDTHGIVDGILFSEGTPMAVVDGKVVSVGQNIDGVKVVKIEQGYVEFEKSGVRWSQKVNESPSTSWPGK